jgi:hypothetical protein
MRGKLLALVALVALAVGGLSVADAASLSIVTAPVSAIQAGPCTTATVPVATTGRWFLWYQGVSFQVPAACRNLPVAITVTTGATNPPTASLPAGTPNGNVALTLSSSPWVWQTSYALVIDGWHIPTSAA